MSHEVDESQSELDPLLPIAQVRVALSVGTTTVYKLVKEGELAKAREIRGTRRVGWKRSDVRRYLDGLPPVDLRPLPGALRGASA